VNILITGATGFIGRHLVSRLAKEGYTVRCLVRNSSDISCLRNLDVDIFYGDLLSKNSLGDPLEHIDLIYHLAGEVYSRKKDDYYKGNIFATQNLLERCEEKGTRRIVFLSSIAVYKPVTTKALLAEESECEPITFYGKTKLDAEKLIKKYNIPWVIVRAPAIYGPHQLPVMNRFFLDAINKRKICILGNGENLRSLCFIDNLIEGLILLAGRLEVEGKTYILSDSSPYTFNEIIKTVSEVMKEKIRIIRLPKILGNVSWKVNSLMGNLLGLYFVELYAIKTMDLSLGCDISKAKKEFGYSPSITLETGIRNTIEWIKSKYYS
jgi:nucleoside-diphosphate-sugar epimerase